MNKDTIYIEPEDDITDIISKIENSKEKIIALVPPKKAGVFRSIVNIKLIAKAGVNAKKKVVLVTTDPAIVRLAASTKLPVTKDLQSAPAIPKIESGEEIETSSVDEVLSEAGEQTEETVVEAIEAEAKPDDKKKDDDSEEDDEESKEDDAEKDKKKADKKKRKTSNKKRGIIIGIIAAVALVLILVGIWAFKIAPAASVTVTIRTTTTNFSENATFTTKLADENAEEGKFYLEEKTYKEPQIVASFEATGSKNVGEKATGNVVVYYYFRGKGSVAVSEGAKFTNSGLSFIAKNGTTLSWDGKDANKCENNGLTSAITSGCLISGRVNVTASEPGVQYNIAASSSGWSATADIGVYSDQAMSGGTSKTITIVTQADVDAAVAKVVEEIASSQAENKAKLMATIPEGAFIIDSSFKRSIGDPTSTPAVGEEVKSGEKATITIDVVDSIYIVDKTKVEEFIAAKAKLAENYKIYEMNDPFIENFVEVGETYIGKIKTSFVSGPKVTENEVIETIRGKGLGEARAALLDAFSGIDSNKTKIEVSYPWVFSVPDNASKITVRIEVEG